MARPAADLRPFRGRRRPPRFRGDHDTLQPPRPRGRTEGRLSLSRGRRGKDQGDFQVGETSAPGHLVRMRSRMAKSPPVRTTARTTITIAAAANAFLTGVTGE